MPLVPLNAPLETADPRQDPLRHLSTELRVLAALIDAMVLPVDWQEWRVMGHVETAILRERPLTEREGWNFSHAQREMARWGAEDQHGIYRAAGLSPTQTRVAEMHFSRQFTSREIGQFLGLEATTVRVHLHDIGRRLRMLNREEVAA